MPRIYQLANLGFEKRESRFQEFQWQTTPNLADTVDSKYLKFYVRSLDPGKFSFPYHFHRASEELFIILSGEATLRSPEGFAKVSAGDIIFFEQGPSGAHQLYNHSEAPCLYFDLGTSAGIDVCEYPDSGKINILPYREIFERSSGVDYYKGEGEIAKRWPHEILRKKSNK